MFMTNYSIVYSININAIIDSIYFDSYNGLIIIFGPTIFTMVNITTNQVYHMSPLIATSKIVDSYGNIFTCANGII